MTTAADLGYDNYGLKPIATAPDSQSTIDTQNFIESLVGGQTTSGNITSNDGKMKIDLNNSRIVISDGIHERVWIGKIS